MTLYSSDEGYKTVFQPATTDKTLMFARERSLVTGFERCDQSFNRRIATQTCSYKGTKEKHDIPGVHEEVLHVSTHPPLDSTIMTSSHASRWVVSLSLLHGVALDHCTKHENGWESISELQNAKSSDKSRQGREVGDSSGNDKGERPVNWDHANPNELSGLLGQIGEAKDLLEDVLVENLDSDVAVQSSGDQGRKEGDDVSGGVSCLWTHTLVGWVDGVLALEAVHKDAEEKVDNIDEGLCADHCLPEVPWLAHLTHELAEEHGTTVRVNGLHETFDSGGEADSIWRSPGISVDDAITLGDVVQIGRRIVVGRSVRNNGHGHDKDDEVEPDGQIGNPTELLERADLANHHTGESPDKSADNVA
jgi:hypothetical protein